jgi:putative ABC transport system substrate-binding protein
VIEVGGQKSVVSKGLLLSPMFYALCSVAAMFFALGFSAEAQQPKKILRIGFLSSPSASSTLAQANYATFREGLRELGYIEGQNIIIEARYAEESEEKGAENVAEMVRLKVDVIVTGSGFAQRVTKTNWRCHSYRNHQCRPDWARIRG